MNKLAFRPTTLLAVITVAALCAAFATNASARADAVAAESVPSGRVALTGHVLAALATATLDSSKAKAKAITDDEPLTLTVVLNRSDPDGFAAYLADVYDPASRTFRQFLTPMQVADRFGPSQAAYDGVLRHLTDAKLQLVEASVNRMTLSVRGTRTDVERALAVTINDYQHESRKFFANVTDPSLPSAIATNVQAITGLSNLAVPVRPQPQTQAFRRALCTVIATLNVYRDRDLVDPLGTASIELQHQAFLHKVSECIRKLGNASATQTYDSADPPPPAWQGADGTGQKVGLLQFDTFNLNDVRDYIALIQLPTAKIGDITQVHVNGGAGAIPGANQDEVLLDIAVVLSFAPGAKIAVYDGPFSGANASFQALFNAMVGDHVNIISNSWTYCEDQTTLADVTSIDSILQGAAASGISVFNASGDSGSTCLNRATNTIGVPASSPSATAVGGYIIDGGPGIHLRWRNLVEWNQRFSADWTGRIRNQQVLCAPCLSSGPNDVAHAFDPGCRD